MTGSPLSFPELFQLPSVLDLRTAALAFGISTSTAYRLNRKNEFPCPVIRVGRHYRVPTAGVFRALCIDELPIYTDDLARGIEYEEKRNDYL
ncbi:DNA-binding protein [Actinocorallia sp. A-T 12471]|uniref:helix-turn-helix transcriptional regulator n=1 Tax=Actinocorallia sp. A-T 12471 TaxID=3089813 RepID=UPI0029D09CC8|nr:DNA-binding protein [Actinocorallia sp. A-T 12471]MDX6742581.1 DNA-binding protein [Actinocorallia sp. A-T 12471]